MSVLLKQLFDCPVSDFRREGDDEAVTGSRNIQFFRDAPSVTREHGRAVQRSRSDKASWRAFAILFLRVLLHGLESGEGARFPDGVIAGNARVDIACVPDQRLDGHGVLVEIQAFALLHKLNDYERGQN